MKVHDVIVAGAGPGGSNAARAALDQGLDVLQIDKAAFPRVKPCAGGLTIKACRSLIGELEPCLKRVFHSVEFNLWRSRENRLSHSLPIVKMVFRPSFDAELVDRNRRFEGFRFIDASPIRAIAWDGKCFRVDTPRGSFAGRTLIGADGAYSIVNRTFGVSRPAALATAVEVNLFADRVQLEAPLPPCFDFGVLDKGYGWVFPKDDHWSVGLYTLAGGLKGVRQMLSDYIGLKGFRCQGDPLETFEAHRIPVGGYRLSVPEAPVFLVGDAAGLADALTGEGIFYALESGAMAGRCAARMLDGRSTHRSYYRRLRLHLLPDTFLTYLAARVFYGNPRRWLRVLEAAPVWRAFVQGYTDGALFVHCLAGWPYRCLKSYGRGAARLHRELPISDCRLPRSKA